MKNSKNLTKRLLRGGSVVIILTIVSSVLSYFLRIFYSRTLSIEQYGLFYAILTLSSTIILYSDFGFNYSTSYLVPKYFKKNNYKIAWNIYKYSQYLGMATTFMAALFLCLFAPWLTAEYFRTPEAQYLIYIFSIFLVANGFVNVQHAFFLGLQQEKYYSSIQAVRVILAIVFSALFLFFKGVDIYIYAIIASFSYVFCALVFNFILFKENPLFKNLKVTWDKKLFKKIYEFAIPSLFANTIYSFIIFSDTFFITLFKGVSDVGIYNIVLPLASIPLIILSPLANFLMPMVSHFTDRDKSKVLFILNNILLYIPFIALYFGLFITLFPSQPVVFLFGEKWSGPVELPLAILALGNIASTMTFFFSTIVMGIGQVKPRLKALSFIALLSVTLNAFFVYNFGVLGASIAACIIQIASILALGKIISTAISFNYPSQFYLKIILFSLILFWLVRSINFHPQSLIVYLITGIIYTLTFTAFAFYLKLFNRQILNILFQGKGQSNIPTENILEN